MVRLKPTAILLLTITMSSAPLVAAEVKVSGHINRLVANIDNGEDSEVQHLDNSGSGTRLKVQGEHAAEKGYHVGFYWETQYQSNPSDQANADTVTDFNDTISSRHRDLYVRADWGKLSIGQGSGAADGITEHEYSGTTFLTGYASPEDLWGSVTFGDIVVAVADVIDGMDGLSRNDRLRYDSPGLGPIPIRLSGDFGQGSKKEFALRFETENDKKSDGTPYCNPENTLCWKGGIAFWDRADQVSGTSEGVGGSVAVLHKSGWNGAIVFGQLDTGASDDPTNIMLQGGYKSGVNAYSIRYNMTQDKTPGVDADGINFGYVNTTLRSIELYAGIQTFSVDDVSDADDITILFGGSRVKF